MVDLANLIDGELVPAQGGAWLNVTEPATGRIYARVPASDAADVNAAVGAASRAFAGWSATPAAERSRLLLRLAALIDRDAEALAKAESVDSGKPISAARSVDIPRAAANFRFFATAILHTRSDLHDADGKHLNYTLRRPRGVAGLISPWNLPLYLLTWKIAPAVATGNTCVAKPSEVTPMTAYLLSKLVEEAGIPPGVINIVHGLGERAGAALVTHAEVPTISFTGSTAGGQWIGENAGRMLKRVSLELGGKNPLIVFDDADVDAAALTALRASMSNQGQICLCGSKMLVQRGVYDRFVAALVERVKLIRVGDPLNDSTEFGALVSEQHTKKVEDAIETARHAGGTVHCGGGRIPAEALPERCRGGCFVAPTVITDLPGGCRVLTEEVFGPVATVEAFEREEDAVFLANSTPYGLAATVFTRDVARAHRVSAQLDAGIVWVNCWMVRDLRTPFGGMKQSGVGREGGEEALRFFTEPKNVCVAV